MRAFAQASLWHRPRYISKNRCRWLHASRSQRNLDSIVPRATEQWSHLPSSATISEHEITRLASLPRRPLTLADLVR